MKNIPAPESILSVALRETFGAACRLSGGHVLAGGTRKQVWRLDLEGAGPRQVVLLAWHNERDYFNERGDADNALNDRKAPALYRANTELLLVHGLRVPRIYHFDDTRSAVPYAFALVEYIRAATFNTYRVERSAGEVESALDKMHITIDGLGAITRGFSGSVLQVEAGPTAFPDQELAGTLPDLEGLARVHPGVGQCVEAVRERLLRLRAGLAPRERFTFVHGELGPDEHLLIDDQGQIVILDIDGCQYADVEREHAYLKLRFAEYYERVFRRPDLDPLRMDFYGICLHIMASYGHYLLLKQGYPGAEDLRRIYEWNAEQVVRIVNEPENHCFS